MSDTPARAALELTRGSTWIDEFTYTDDDGVAIDLTGYSARLQVRTLDDEFANDATPPLLELLTTGPSPGLVWATAATGRLTIPGLAPSLHAMLNPDNERKARYAYAVQLLNATTGRVIPLVNGPLTVYGWGVR